MDGDNIPLVLKKRILLQYIKNGYCRKHGDVLGTLKAVEEHVELCGQWVVFQAHKSRSLLWPCGPFCCQGALLSSGKVCKINLPLKGRK